MKPKTEGQMKKGRLPHLSDPYIKARGGKNPQHKKDPLNNKSSHHSCLSPILDPQLWKKLLTHGECKHDASTSHFMENNKQM